MSNPIDTALGKIPEGQVVLDNPRSGQNPISNSDVLTSQYKIPRLQQLVSLRPDLNATPSTPSCAERGGGA